MTWRLCVAIAVTLAAVVGLCWAADDEMRDMVLDFVWLMLGIALLIGAIYAFLALWTWAL